MGGKIPQLDGVKQEHFGRTFWKRPHGGCVAHKGPYENAGELPSPTLEQQAPANYQQNLQIGSWDLLELQLIEFLRLV
jgi:hypothetical protein